MYSTLMVHLYRDQDNAALLDITADLAERFNADVVGIVAYQPILVAGNDALPASVIEHDRAEIVAQMEAAEKEFRAALQHGSRRLEWRSKLTYGAPTAYIVEQLRSADLLITGVDHRASWLDPTPRVDTADLVLQAGRPVLVVPAQTRQLVADNILVGWKDTGETRRAVSDALPFLRMAKRVVVAEVVANDAVMLEARQNTADVCSWLMKHKISAEPLVLAADDKYGFSLDAIAEDQGADLIVAGGYGHSRLRQWVLGGVTRDLLKHAERCALLSH